MKEVGEFKGFSKKTVKFLRDLAKNNNKQWFAENRQVFDDEVIAPARAFVVEMGKRLEFIVPNVQADPKVNRSLFRISRDTRFAKDKTPYKNHLGIWLWEGEGPRMECSGFYFHVEPPNLLLGAGIYCFPRSILPAFRKAVVHKKTGPALIKALDEVKSNGDYELGVKHYKRIPKGFDGDHPNADYLLYNGLTAHSTAKIPQEFYSSDLVDYCAAGFVDMLPIHQWLYSMAEKAKSQKA